ncbi:hypothetical protein SEA_SIXAMA_44 [Gordonia phage Sixama]|uniref:Uncharacterized protein n=1 Tax=Gordonia phage Sixama TaxID=2653271 RepID=A0A5Q2F680_9CAUD|nr:hypothetical protein PP302_gp044 [Gordonia phage Sixama]QGF20223.1 hypothetical protein SEA_SIXAMA_44 [Gordonia phage Sixama]
MDTLAIIGTSFAGAASFMTWAIIRYNKWKIKNTPTVLDGGDHAHMWSEWEDKERNGALHQERRCFVCLKLETTAPKATKHVCSWGKWTHFRDINHVRHHSDKVPFRRERIYTRTCTGCGDVQKKSMEY